MRRGTYCLFGFLALVLCGCAEPKHAKPTKAPKVLTFHDHTAWQKLDLRLQTAWKEAATNHRREQPLECLMKTVRRLNDVELQELTAAGFNRRAVAGRIITGSVTVRNTEKVAKLATVNVMELAVPLTTK